MAIENDERLVSSAIEEAKEEGSRDSMEIKPVLPQEFRENIEEVGGSDARSGSSATEDVKRGGSKNSKGTKPVMPQEVRDAMEEVGGFDAELAIEKRLTIADTATTYSRLMMRFKSPTKRKFLKGIELREYIAGVPILVIDPSLNVRVMSLTLSYETIEDSLNNNPIYILIDSWDVVLKRNKLKAGDSVQIWMFKVTESDDIDEPRLGLALVRTANCGHAGEAR